MTNAELIAAAKAVVGDRKLSGECSAGSVAAALVTEGGAVYIGVCIDAACGIGFCAEHTAIAQMVTRGESRIIKIVALTEDGTFLPPCGRCRELMYQVDNGNLETKILLGPHRITQLSDLLPMRWQDA
ncbi:MAG: cytidine deaminase [Anaerolineae bacterium]|jgi:cytidine deaminase|nr:cytidine deaminase [Anaerolineae bacterium]